jgi:hypothetical protein
VKTGKTIIAKAGAGTIGCRRTLEFEAGDNITLDITDNASNQKVTVKVSSMGGGSSDHATLTHLAWTASGHTGTANRAPVFNPAGAAAEVSGSPGQVLGWLPSGALGALSVAVLALAYQGGVEIQDYMRLPENPAAYQGGTIS